MGEQVEFVLRCDRDDAHSVEIGLRATGYVFDIRSIDGRSLLDTPPAALVRQSPELIASDKPLAPVSESLSRDIIGIYYRALHIIELWTDDAARECAELAGDAINEAFDLENAFIEKNKP